MKSRLFLERFGFLPYQIDYLLDTSQVKLCEKSRRIGMTYTQAFEDVIDAGIESKFDVWFSSNNDLNGREYIRYCKEFAKALNMVVKDLSGEDILEDTKVYSIEFRNGKRITALSSSPEQIHGKGGKIVLDEFARREDQSDVWEAASPAALIWGYPIRIISTHNGKSCLFYQFVENVKQGKIKENWHLFSTTFTRAVDLGLADKVKAKALNQEERNNYIEEVRKSVNNPTIWAQQFMCEPQDDNEAFIPYSLLFDNLQDCLLTYDQLSECGDLFAGLDIARVGHLSVLYIVEKIQEKLVTRYILTMQNETFPNQLRQIKKILTMPNVRRLALDYTGMGIGIGDDLTENYPLGMIDCITFTPKAKQELGFRIRNLLQDKAFALPNDQIILEDFHSIKKINSATHTIRLVSEENKETSSHSDYFWAAALAGHSASSDSYIAINEKSIKSIASQVWLGTKKILQGFDKTIDRT